MAHPFSIATDGYLDGVLGIATNGYLHDQVVEPPVVDTSRTVGPKVRDRKRFEEWLEEGTRITLVAKARFPRLSGQALAYSEFVAEDAIASCVCAGEARFSLSAAGSFEISWKSVIEDDDEWLLMLD